MKIPLLVLQFKSNTRTNRVTRNRSLYLKFIHTVLGLHFFASVVLLLIPIQSYTQNKNTEDVETLFSSVKTDSIMLCHFFESMPKGGDIHHHAHGSVFAEDYIEVALKDDLFISVDEYKLYKYGGDSTDSIEKKIIPLRIFLNKNPENIETIIDNWSTRNYIHRKESGYQLFFNSFEKFFLAMKGSEVELLSEICFRASKSNISYLETMLSIPSIENKIYAIVKDANIEFDHVVHSEILDSLFVFFNDKGIKEISGLYANQLRNIYEQTNKFDVKLKFLTYGLRTNPNLAEVFGQLHLAFQTANISYEVVGVNFVAPEDNQIALQDYLNHMKIFHFLKAKFPSVNISLHAGELVPNLNGLNPKNLSFHISQAINIGEASRIGHGVSILYEKHIQDLIEEIKIKNIAIEINLESNEVILNTNPKNHPLTFYLENNIPITISTDDEGVLRSSLTNQYMLLVKYAPSITFKKVKSIVYNSIEYSFYLKMKSNESKPS